MATGMLGIQLLQISGSNLAIELSDWPFHFYILAGHLVHAGITAIISTRPPEQPQIPRQSVPFCRIIGATLLHTLA